MGTIFHIEFRFMETLSHTFIVKSEKPITHGEALKKAVNEYDPYLFLDVIGVKVVYIGE